MARLCNVVYAQIVDDAGPMADRAEVRSHIDGILNRPVKGQKSASKAVRRPGQLSREQAMKMASDLAEYDSKVVKGQVS